MRNVILPKENYSIFRKWLRETKIIWRDVVDSAIVPLWGEAICDESVCFEGKTPGEIAWGTLAKSYPKLNLRWRTDEIKLLDARPPKYFKGRFTGDLYLLDIARCYNQLYERLHLHSDYPITRPRYPLFDVAQAVKENKSARNAVIGVTRSTRNKWVQGTKVWYKEKHNRFLSPTLWAQIQNILNQSASKALSFGAIHINTDGYVFDNLVARQFMAEWLDSYGVETKAQEGYGSIIGINTVFIPGVKEPSVLETSRVCSHVESDDTINWLDWWAKLKP